MTEFKDELDHKHTDEITCPYCFYEVNDSWEQEDNGIIQCDECGEEFKYSREIEVTYSSDKINTNPLKTK